VARFNTDKQERFPYELPDGKYLFFTRHIEEYDEDIWWIEANIIEKLKGSAKFK